MDDDDDCNEDDKVEVCYKREREGQAEGGTAYSEWE